MYNVQFMLPITHGEQSADGWKNAGKEKPTNGDEEIAMSHAESYEILIPEGSNPMTLQLYKCMKWSG